MNLFFTKKDKAPRGEEKKTPGVQPPVKPKPKGQGHRRMNSAPVSPVGMGTPRRVQFNMAGNSSAAPSSPRSPSTGDYELPELLDNSQDEGRTQAPGNQPRSVAPDQRSRPRRASVGGGKALPRESSEPRYKVRADGHTPASAPVSPEYESPKREKARREVLLANFLQVSGMLALTDNALYQRMVNGLDPLVQGQDELTLATLRDRALELLKKETGEAAAELREALVDSNLRFASPRAHTLSKQRLDWNRVTHKQSPASPRQGVLAKARGDGQQQDASSPVQAASSPTTVRSTPPSLEDCQRAVAEEIQRQLQGKAPGAALWVQTNLPPVLQRLVAGPGGAGLLPSAFRAYLKNYLANNPKAADAEQVLRVVKRLERRQDPDESDEQSSNAEEAHVEPGSTANTSSSVKASKEIGDDDEIVGTNSTSGEDSSDELYELENQTREIVDALFDARVDRLKKVWSKSKNKTGQPPDFFAVRDSDLKAFARDEDPPEVFKSFNTEQLRAGRGTQALRKLVRYLEKNHRDGDGSLYESQPQQASPAKSPADATTAWLATKSAQQHESPSPILRRLAEPVLKHMLAVDELPHALKVELRQADRRLVDLWMRSVKEGKNPPSAQGLLDGRLALAQAICGLVGYTRLINEQQGGTNPENPIGLRVLRRLLLQGLNPLHNPDAARFYAQVLHESEQALPDRQRWQVQKARAKVAADAAASPASPKSPVSTSSPASVGATSSTASTPLRKRGV